MQIVVHHSIFFGQNSRNEAEKDIVSCSKPEALVKLRA